MKPVATPSKPALMALKPTLSIPASRGGAPETCANPAEPAEANQLIIEITTGGGYTPRLELSPEQHLAELETKLEQACELAPLRINLITGSDCWTDPEQHDFLAAVLDRLEQVSCPVMLETHRSRSLFNPWRLPFWLQQHPRLRLTADLSHWCAVSERLMTPDLKPIQAMASHVDHIHARVGHAQGAGFAPVCRGMGWKLLEAHRLCWQLFLDRRGSKGNRSRSPRNSGLMATCRRFTFSAEPLADVDAINRRHDLLASDDDAFVDPAVVVGRSFASAGSDLPGGGQVLA